MWTEIGKHQNRTVFHMKIALVLLTYNEIDGVRALYDQIPFDAVDEAFAVDGGSTDGTLGFFEEKGFRVVRQISKGRGEAFRIAYANSACDALIFFSPDGNEDPADVPKIVSELAQGHDIVIASRMLPESTNEEDDQTLRWRKWANNAFTLLANLIWNRGRPYVTDTINGFRAIRRSAFEMIQPDSVGYTIEYQTSIRAMKLGLKIKEIPTVESDRIGGESYARSLPTGIRMLKTLWSEVRIGDRFARES